MPLDSLDFDDRERICLQEIQTNLVSIVFRLIVRLPCSRWNMTSFISLVSIRNPHLQPLLRNWNVEISYFTFHFLNNFFNLVVSEELLKDPCIWPLDFLDFDVRERIGLARDSNKLSFYCVLTQSSAALFKMEYDFFQIFSVNPKSTSPASVKGTGIWKYLTLTSIF